VTQPPDDETRRFDAFRDDDSTRAMPPVPPSGGGGDDGDDDRTRMFGFRDDRFDEEQTRRMPAAGGYGDDATRAMPPAGGRARGTAVPPVYGGGHSRYDEYSEYSEEEPPPQRSGRRLALIIAGIVATMLLVVVAGVALGTTLFGGGPSSDTTPSAAPTTLEPTPSETLSATPSESPPPPEGPGPRVLDVSAPPRVDCSDGGTARFQLNWRVADADRVDLSRDGNEIQQYDPNDAPVSVPFPCDGQAHKYQVTAISNSDRTSQPTQVTVRPEEAPASPTPSLLFPTAD
jgi:hypothetical protein